MDTSQQHTQQLAGPPNWTNHSGSSIPAQQPHPQPSVQLLSQELAAAQRKLSQYTNLIANLYGELETIRNIVCNNCKNKISPANVAQHLPPKFQFPTESSALSPCTHHILPAGASDTAPFPNGHDVLSLGSHLTISYPSSPVPPTLSPPPSEKIQASPFPPPSTNSAEGAIVKPRWSVRYRSEIEQVLDITFLHAFKHTTSVNAVRFSPDGNFLAAGLTHLLGRMQIYDVKTRSMKCILAEYSDKKNLRVVWSLSFSPDGQFLVAGGTSGMIYLWELSKKRLRATHHTGCAVRSLDFSPDGSRLVTGSSDGAVRVWTIRDGSSWLLTTKRSPFKLVRFSPNGRYIAASNVDQFLRIWDVRSGNLMAMWDGHNGARIRCLAFAPDGVGLVSGDCGGSVMSWDIGSLSTLARSSPVDEGQAGELLQKKLKFDGHSGEVRTIAISPDGKWVITGSSDKRVCVWDRQTAVEHCTLEGHVNYVTSVDFSPVGNYIATGSADGFVTLWRY